jgi:Mce-associated membrane protein
VSIDMSKETPAATGSDSMEADAAAHDATASDRERPTVADAPGGRLAVTMVAAAALVVALIAAAWFGTGWVRAAFFTDGPRAEARDTALADARQAAINLMSLDPNDVDGSLELIQSSMTGSLLDDATKTQDQFREQAKQAKTRLESKVIGSSLTALNSERDHASALIVLQTTRTVPDVTPYSYRQTWALDLVKQGEVWKAEKASPLSQPIPLNQPTAGQPGATPSEGAAPKPGS